MVNGAPSFGSVAEKVSLIEGKLNSLDDRLNQSGSAPDVFDNRVAALERRSDHCGEELSDFGGRLIALERYSDHRGEALNDFGGRLVALERYSDHRGEALNDFGGRLAALERQHEDVRDKFGRRLRNIEHNQVSYSKRLLTEANRSNGQAGPTNNGSAASSGTFLGHCPERYNKNLAKYMEAGGNFDPVANSITYANGDMVRFYAFGMFFDLIQKDKLSFDIAELGVWKGDTAVLLADFARKIGATAYLLDTYKGFDERDLESDEERLKGAFSDTSLEAVRARVGDDNVRYVAGYFPDTASQLPSDNKYCFVHIDCDLFGPMLSALEYFYPRVVSGGFLIMHDYMSLSWEGPVKAIDQFFAGKPEFVVPIPDFAGTVVIRKQ
jgi:O-methyltransferase